MKEIIFMFQILYTQFRKGFYSCIIQAICCTPLMFIGAYVPKLILEMLERNVSFTTFLLYLLLILVVWGIANYIVNYASFQSSMISTQLMFSNRLLYSKTIMSLDYEQMEKPEIRDLMNKARATMTNNGSSALNLPAALASAVSGFIGLFFSISTVMSVHWLLLVVLVVTHGLSLLRMRTGVKNSEKSRSLLSASMSKQDYFFKVFKNPVMNKDIRLYSLQSLLSGKLDTAVSDYKKNIRKVQMESLKSQICDGVLALLRDGCSYMVLVISLIKGKIDLGDFLFVIAVLGTVSTWINSVFGNIGNVARGIMETSDIMRFASLDHSELETTEKSDIQAPSIVFEDVYYTYPGNIEPTIRGFSFTVHSGERIALVGVNGAGKTTLIKLMLGLYHAQSGRILINGRNIEEMEKNELFSLFSVVFQDIQILPTSIASNITGKNENSENDEKLQYCLNQSKLNRLIMTLPEGIYTKLGKNICKNAVDLSGGEKQRLALAKAIYREASVLVLDEPSAAMDPVAEKKLYESYAELTNSKTSVYISHRLASTRFCDRIVLLENGCAAEVGSHEELLQLNGRYAQMFQIQAKYYSESLEESII